MQVPLIFQCAASRIDRHQRESDEIFIKSRALASRITLRVTLRNPFSIMHMYVYVNICEYVACVKSAAGLRVLLEIYRIKYMCFGLPNRIENAVEYNAGACKYMEVVLL